MKSLFVKRDNSVFFKVMFFLLLSCFIVLVSSIFFLPNQCTLKLIGMHNNKTWNLLKTELSDFANELLIS